MLIFCGRVGSVVDGLDSKPTCAILLCLWAVVAASGPPLFFGAPSLENSTYSFNPLQMFVQSVKNDSE